MLELLELGSILIQNHCYKAQLKLYIKSVGYQYQSLQGAGFTACIVKDMESIFKKFRSHCQNIITSISFLPAGSPIGLSPLIALKIE